MFPFRLTFKLIHWDIIQEHVLSKDLFHKSTNSEKPQVPMFASQQHM